MRTDMTDYPEDVMKLAEEALDNLLCNCTASCGGYDGLRAASISDIARAIMQDRASRIRSCLLDKEIDELAYRFWSVHPKELDNWVDNDPHPPMPHDYKGGVRAWFFACKMRELICLLDKPEA